MKKILVVLTNKTQYGYHPEATGLWLGEATEFVEVVKKPDLMSIMSVLRVALYQLIHEASSTLHQLICKCIRVLNFKSMP